MAIRYPGLDWLVNWAAEAPASVGVGNFFKDELLAAAQTWYATNEADRYPNTINEMLYAYLLANYADFLEEG